MPENNDIEIRSDEVQEILSGVPSWMIRWGITLIFGIILMFITLAYFIKYPDVIEGTVKLTTVNPPNKLVTKASGEIERIFVSDKEEVKKGQVIAQIRNIVSKSEVEYLSSKLEEVEENLKDNFRTSVDFTDKGMVFGELQGDYNTLKNAVNDYMLSVNIDQYEKRVGILRRQIANYRKLDKISDRQDNYADENFKRAEERYKSNKALFEQNVISKNEFYEQEKMFTQVKNEIENLKKSNVQNQITLTDYEKQLNELEFEFLNKKGSLSKSIEISIATIRNQISNWEETFEIRANKDGKVSYLEQLSENQFVESGKTLFAIIPSDEDNYIAYVEIDKLGYGKVEIGQTVKMKMDNFPYNQYGQLQGVVQKISLIPNEDKYTIEVGLSNGLVSTYKKELVYTPEMSGQASIVTEDLRILERIFSQFRKIFDN